MKKTRRRVSTDAGIRVRVRDLLQTKIEIGLEVGWNRAHKHLDDPGKDVILEKQFDAVMLELDETFDFDDELG